LAHVARVDISGHLMQGGLVWPKVEDWNGETTFCGHYRSIFNHCDVIGQRRYRIRWKNAK